MDSFYALVLVTALLGCVFELFRIRVQLQGLNKHLLSISADLKLYVAESDRQAQRKEMGKEGPKPDWEHFYRAYDELLDGAKTNEEICSVLGAELLRANEKLKQSQGKTFATEQEKEEHRLLVLWRDQTFDYLIALRRESEGR